jgi:hypothetical protein
MAQFDHGWGRDFAAGIGSKAEDNKREVIRQVGPRIDPELVKADGSGCPGEPQAAVVTSGPLPVSLGSAKLD